LKGDETPYKAKRKQLASNSKKVKWQKEKHQIERLVKKSNNVKKIRK